LSEPRTIVIVGAGLCGTLVAVNLLRSLHSAATRVVLIERSAAVARGKAYAAREQDFLLNVPAGRMSVDPRRPLDFLSFAQQRLSDATPEDFLPRALYGDYLQARLHEARTNASGHVRFDRLQAQVCTVERVPEGADFQVGLSDGRRIRADDVVLALGNPPPAQPVEVPEDLPGAGDATGCPRYVADPWSADLHFRAGEQVLLIGSGLTMADVVCAADRTSQGRVRLHAISRHGLLPPSQTEFVHAGVQGDKAAMLRAASFSALTLFRSVRELADETLRRGGDWREAVTFIRNIAPALWQRLPLRERRRLLRHVRPYWDIHRHRLPRVTLERLHTLRRQQRLHLHAGRILKMSRHGDQVSVQWRPRGARKTQQLLVDSVVNCTGPDYNVARSTDPLLQSLLRQGLVSVDALNLGLRTGPCGALLDRGGQPAAHLFYVGPLLRADYWEATAAQELRAHAALLAGHLAAASTSAGAASLPITLSRPAWA
jgi:uncharacterized NAD(P)/FAD-binding protein YdhS